MKKLFLLLFLISCASPNYNYKANNVVLDFDKDLSFDELSELIIKYAEISPYPNIDY